MIKEKIQLTELRAIVFQLAEALGFEIVENFETVKRRVRPHLTASELLATYKVVRRG